MRKFLLSLVALATLGATLAIAAPANAAFNVGCVTRAEFRAVHANMTRARVHQIFGTTGRHEDGYINEDEDGIYNDEWREYRACSGFGGTITINFDNYSYTDDLTPGATMRLYSKNHYSSW